MVLSIIVCTYNREKFLGRCLHSIVEQIRIHKENDLIELSVIDNNSNDGTRPLVEEIQHKSTIKINYFIEKNQGLSHARNRGIKESNANYIAFIDDDATIMNNWLSSLIKGIKEINADVFGGPIYPNFEIKLPEWIDKKYFIRKFKSNNGLLKPLLRREGFSGGNMCVKKELFETIGYFNTDLGMIGNQLGLGEESEFFYRLYTFNKNCSLYNLESMAINHFEAKEKLTKSYLKKRIILSGNQYAIRTISQEKMKGLVIVMLKIIKQIASSIPYFITRNKFKGLKSFWVIKGLIKGIRSK